MGLLKALLFGDQAKVGLYSLFYSIGRIHTID
jgi:hypothetical protein